MILSAELQKGELAVHCLLDGRAPNPLIRFVITFLLSKRCLKVRFLCQCVVHTLRDIVRLQTKTASRETMTQKKGRNNTQSKRLKLKQEEDLIKRETPVKGEVLCWPRIVLVLFSRV